MKNGLSVVVVCLLSAALIVAGLAAYAFHLQAVRAAEHAEIESRIAHAAEMVAAEEGKK